MTTTTTSIYDIIEGIYNELSLKLDEKEKEKESFCNGCPYRYDEHEDFDGNPVPHVWQVGECPEDECPAALDPCGGRAGPCPRDSEYEDICDDIAEIQEQLDPATPVLQAAIDEYWAERRAQVQ